MLGSAWRTHAFTRDVTPRTRCRKIEVWAPNERSTFLLWSVRLGEKSPKWVIWGEKRRKMALNPSAACSRRESANNYNFTECVYLVY